MVLVLHVQIIAMTAKLKLMQQSVLNVTLDSLLQLLVYVLLVTLPPALNVQSLSVQTVNLNMHSKLQPTLHA